MLTPPGKKVNIQWILFSEPVNRLASRRGELDRQGQTIQNAKMENHRLTSLATTTTALGR